MKTLNILLLFLITLSANESFYKSKKELRKIYQGHQKTFYCACKYNFKNNKNVIDKKSCGYNPRNRYYKSGKPNQRAKRIEWEHIMPAENFGRQLQCWRKGHSKCIKKNGKPFKGRKCCEKVSEKFRIMQADMHNLVPAIGELNGDRSNYRYDFYPAQPKQYGECKFEVLFKEKRARVKKDIRGNIARAYLYMSDRYNILLSKQEQLKFNSWNKEDPVDEWEYQRNKSIINIQGNLNSYIMIK